MDERFEKYARLLIEIGINVKEGETLIIEAPVDAAELVRECTKIAFERKAKDVIVFYDDPYIDLERLKNLNADSLIDVPLWETESRRHYLEKGASSLAIKSAYPYLYADCKTENLNALREHHSEVRQVIRSSIAKDGTKWCVACYPNSLWARHLYPELEEQDALLAAKNLFFDLCHIREGEDPVQNWIDHINRTQNRGRIIDSYHLDRIVFENSIGTSLEVGLMPEAHFSSGDKLFTREGYCWNIPTEEIATAPDKYRVNGTVVASKPLELGGTIIKDFMFKFENGKVVSFHAKENGSILQNILDTVEGARYLGEVALVPYDSPISKSGKLFYNTLLDENASCHLALGSGYAMSVHTADAADISTWENVHLNYSKVHIDFMFGTPDMTVTGYDLKGQSYPIFKNGNFVF